jgi:pyruvate-formate lyase
MAMLFIHLVVELIENLVQHVFNAVQVNRKLVLPNVARWHVNLHVIDRGRELLDIIHQLAVKIPNHSEHHNRGKVCDELKVNGHSTISSGGATTSGATTSGATTLQGFGRVTG